jgi:hypothetical protein
VNLLLMYTQLPVGAGRLPSAETSAIRRASVLVEHLGESDSRRGRGA